MAVIRPAIETDPAELERIAFEYLTVAMPDWRPAEGDLMSWLLGAHARMVAEERDLAADVPFEQILRPLGERVHRVSQWLPRPATVRASVTLRDHAGYTIPAGMEVLVRTAGDDGVTMVVDQSRSVRRDATARDDTPKPTVEVTLRAAPGREGVEGNGLGPAATVVPLRAYDFIESIVLTSTSSGGYDGETDEAYYQRLVDALALTSQVPVLASDFAGIARQHPSVGRALAVNRHLWRPEILQLRVYGSSSLSMPGLEKVVLTEGMSPASVRDAFVAEGFVATVDAVTPGTDLSGVNAMRVTLSGRASYGPWSLGAANTVHMMGGIDFVVLQHGGERNAVPHAVTVAVVTPEGDRLPDAARAEVRELLEERRELNWRISIVDATYTAIDVTARFVAWPSHDARTVAASADAALREFLSPARWGRGESRAEDGGVDWIDEPKVRYLEVAQALNEVPGLRYLTQLEIGRGGSGVKGTDDIDLEGLAPLPDAGVIDVKVEGS